MTYALPAIYFGAAMLGGASRASKSKANAGAARRAGDWQARMISMYGAYNAQVQRAIAQQQAQALTQAAEANAKIAQMSAAYRAGVVKATKEYDAALYENESRLVWQQARLEMYQIEREGNLAISRGIVTFAGSGAVIEAGGTTGAVVMDMETEKNLEKAIVKQQATIKSSKLLDAAAISRWEATVAANGILYEGSANAAVMLNNAQAQASSIKYAGEYGARLTAFQATIDAMMMRYSGRMGAWNQNQQGRASLLLGFLQGLQGAAGTWPNKPPTPSTNKSLLGGP